MQMHRRHFVQALGSAAALGSLSPLQALAQALDQVKIMYGFPAGSSGDSVARRVESGWAARPTARARALWRTSPAPEAASRWRP